MSASERDDVLGQNIVRVMRTAWSEPTLVLDGMGDAYYCGLYLELGSGKYLELFDFETKVLANVNESLEPLESHLVPKMRLGIITGLLQDDIGQHFLLLNRRYYLHCDSAGVRGAAVTLEYGPIHDLIHTRSPNRYYYVHWSMKPWLPSDL